MEIWASSCSRAHHWDEHAAVDDGVCPGIKSTHRARARATSGVQYGKTTLPNSQSGRQHPSENGDEMSLGGSERTKKPALGGLRGGGAGVLLVDQGAPVGDLLPQPVDGLAMVIRMDLDVHAHGFGQQGSVVALSGHAHGKDIGFRPWERRIEG